MQVNPQLSPDLLIPSKSISALSVTLCARENFECNISESASGFWPFSFFRVDLCRRYNFLRPGWNGDNANLNNVESWLNELGCVALNIYKSIQQIIIWKISKKHFDVFGRLS